MIKGVVKSKIQSKGMAWPLITHAARKRKLRFSAHAESPNPADVTICGEQQSARIASVQYSNENGLFVTLQPLQMTPAFGCIGSTLGPSINAFSSVENPDCAGCEEATV